MPLRPLLELEGGHLDHAVLLGGIGDMDAFVDGQACYLAQVVVGMCPDGADAVGAEGYPFGTPAVYLKETGFARHESWKLEVESWKLKVGS